MTDRDELEKWDGKPFEFRYAIDHNCKNYPDVLTMNVLISSVCPFCQEKFDIKRCRYFATKLTKKQQDELLPIWEREHKRLQEIYLKIKGE